MLFHDWFALRPSATIRARWTQDKVAKLYRKFRGPLMLKYLKELAANDQAMAMFSLTNRFSFWLKGSIRIYQDLSGSMSFIVKLILATNDSLTKLPPEADTMIYQSTMSAVRLVVGA